MLWERSFERLHLRAPNGVFESLIERYSEPHRAYHTLQHIGECFEQLYCVRDASQSDAVGLALWFHDSIYDPHASDNEARSAEWARVVLTKSSAPNRVIDAVERMILATKHDAEPQEHDVQLVVDIDLSILGADEGRYLEYEEQIRREYEWVEESAFRRGRLKVLQTFLGRSSIYSTDDFCTRLEVRARSNLVRSIAVLTGASNT